MYQNYENITFSSGQYGAHLIALIGSILGLTLKFLNFKTRAH